MIRVAIRPLHAALPWRVVIPAGGQLSTALGRYFVTFP